MSLVEPLPMAARRVARRAGFGRGGYHPIHRLRVDPARAAAQPTLYMLCPDYERPSGGLRKQYRAVDVLNSSGLSAAVVHRRAGFRLDWFEHDTRIVAMNDVALGPRDVVAVPEVYGAELAELPRGIRQVIFNQGAYLALEHIVKGGEAATAPYADNPDLAAVVVVSDDSAEAMRYAFPHAPVHRIRHGIDPAVHHPPSEPPGRRIAYMTRRRSDDAAQVLRLLELRDALDGWEVVPIHGRSEREVADILRDSRIFLSFSQREGFGLPPLEALACGCMVVGFHGFGGRELFHPPFAHAIEDSDVVAFARAVEDVIRRVDEEPAAIAAASEAGARFALEQYSQAAERQSLIDVFGPMLAA
jgi:glycosyltransferase involved in cell wall biosynthesis